MPSPRRSAQESLHDIEVLKKHGSIRQAAIAEGVAPSTMAHRVRRIRETFPGSLPDATKQGTWAKDDQWQGESPAFEYPEIPDDEPSYEELKDRQIKDFQRLKANRALSDRPGQQLASRPPFSLEQRSQYSLRLPIVTALPTTGYWTLAQTGG